MFRIDVQHSSLKPFSNIFGHNPMNDGKDEAFNKMSETSSKKFTDIVTKYPTNENLDLGSISAREYIQLSAMVKLKGVLGYVEPFRECTGLIYEYYMHNDGSLTSKNNNLYRISEEYKIKRRYIAEGRYIGRW